MNITDVFTCAPGSRILVACALKAQESMIDTLCSSIPSTFKAKTSLNSTSIASMDVAPDDNPNRFSDLHGLCAKLINAAGRRSHFEGLLLLNISALASTPGNTMRLKALGEFLAVPEGLSSRCVTLLYGPDKERDIISCADHLDFDGRLKVICYEQPNKLSLSELLTKSSLRCASPEIEHLLESTLTDMSGYEDFSASKFVRICGNEHGVITAHELNEMLSDPYSYINRIKKVAKLQSEEPPVRKIGFQAPR